MKTTRLVQLRKQNKMSQEKLAKMLGISRSTVAMWENNTNEPDNETIIKIANIFNVTTDYLLGTNSSNIVNKGKRIPVFSQVAAGIPISAIEDIIDYEEISEQMASNGEYFGLVIKGDSMEPKISTGDVVIVRKQSTIENGEIAIVLINGEEGTCKKIKKTPEGVMLISLNPAHEPIFYTNKEIEQLPVQIVGKVVELRAKF